MVAEAPQSAKVEKPPAKFDDNTAPSRAEKDVSQKVPARQSVPVDAKNESGKG